MRHLQACLDDGKTIWGKIRGFVMFTIACIASPCCTPLIVPIVIALLAGSPVAIWMSQNLGLVYGGLTLISILSFVLGFRWMRKTNRNTGFAQPESSLVSSTPKIKR
jgi:membrane protein implicated in regulation of membrane protease activity